MMEFWVDIGLLASLAAGMTAAYLVRAAGTGIAWYESAIIRATAAGAIT